MWVFEEGICLAVWIFFFNGSTKESVFLSVGLVRPCLCPSECVCVCMCMYVCVSQRERKSLTVILSVCHHWYSQFAGGETSWYFCLTVQLPSQTRPLFPLGPSADRRICACVSVCVCVCARARERGISQTKQDNVWPYGQWFWDLFHPQVTVKLSERQVCSSPRCTSPCLYLQLFSPLSANILLTTLHSKKAGQVNKSHKELCWSAGG